jgi:hypothetical protein
MSLVGPIRTLFSDCLVSSVLEMQNPCKYLLYISDPLVPLSFPPLSHPRNCKIYTMSKIVLGQMIERSKC